MSDLQGTPLTFVREATEMLLRLGVESYHPSIVAQEGDRLQVSPYAGEQVKLEHIGHTTVGPKEYPCNRHVAAIFRYGRDEVMVYGKVTYGETRLFMIELSIYINGQSPIYRFFHAQGGKLLPDGMPDGFDPYAQ